MKTTDIELANKDTTIGKEDTTKGGLSVEDDAAKPKKLGYWGLGMTLLVMILLWLACIVLRYESIDWGRVECELDNTDDAATSLCIRQNAVYRVSAVVTVFFTIHAVAILWDVQAVFDYYWLIKLPVIVVACFCIVYFNSTFFDDEQFVWWARVAAFIFIIFQQIILLDFAYWWNSKWITRANVNAVAQNYIDTSDFGMLWNNIWYLGLFVVSCVLFGIFIVSMSLLYHYYGGDGCYATNTIISISLVGMVGAGVIQLSTSHGSIITTTVLMIYVAYVTYLAVALNPDDQCNPLANTANEGDYNSGPAIAGIVISFVSIVYMGTRTTRAISALFSSGNTLSVIGGQTSGASSAPDFKKKLRSSVFFYNVVYAFLALYLAMINTNWGLRVQSVQVANPSTGKIAMWMQATAAWITIAFYIVALVVPIFDMIPNSVWDYYPKSMY